MNSEILNKIINKIDLGFKSRFPMIYQTESSECGLACLAMICSYYGKNIDLFYLRQQFNLSSRGTDLSGLNEVASKMSMSTRAVALELNELTSIRLPCVLHWEFKHFVVLTAIKKINSLFTTLHLVSCALVVPKCLKNSPA